MTHLYDELLFECDLPEGHPGKCIPNFCIKEVRCDCPKCASTTEACSDCANDHLGGIDPCAKHLSATEADKERA